MTDARTDARVLAHESAGQYPGCCSARIASGDERHLPDCNRVTAIIQSAFAAARNEALEEASALIYMPGQWCCAKCNFQLTQRALNAQDGTVSARDAPGDHCPNCNSPLWRVTYREAWKDMMEIAEKAIADSSRLRAVVDAARKLKFGGYPAHGSGFVIIITEGNVDDLASSIAALDRAEGKTTCDLANSIESLEVSVHNAMAKIDELRADNRELRAKAHHADEVADAFAKEADQLRTKLARAAEGLRPFAKLAGGIPQLAAGEGITIWNVEDPDYSIEIGTVTTDDCYSAAAVLAELDKP